MLLKKGAISITEIEQKKEYLKSYKNLCSKIRSLEEQKMSIIDTMTSARAQNYSGMPSSGRQSDLSDYMVKLEKIKNSIFNANAKCLASKIKIESAVLSMENGIESAVLHKKYILFKGWETIASELNYSVRQIYNIHGMALQHIEIGGLDESNCS